jgi:hypothetical protein
MIFSEDKTILVVATIRNVEKTLISEVNKCISALDGFKSIEFYLVESDSTDRTCMLLDQLKNDLSNFSYKSLGVLQKQIPDRLERIRYCRNFYIRYIQSLSKEKMPKYVLVVDLDGMNSALNSKSVRSCFVREDWDVVLANQTFGYYDILALRHPIWQKSDWTVEFEELKKKKNRPKSNFLIYKVIYFLSLDKIKRQVLYSKMVRINKKDSWIEVESGFGGAAIYKTEVLLKHDYSKEFESAETDHVSLHRKILRDGGKIFINPRFINSHFNTYNINRYFILRMIRILIWRNKSIYKSKLYQLIKKINL